MVRLYIDAKIKGAFVDGIHGAPYIAAPWIRHGIVNPIIHVNPIVLVNINPFSSM